VLLTYRLEIRGRLPSVAREELRRRFGKVEVRSLGGRTVVSGLTVDQAALRAVLGLLWDVGCEIQLVRAMSPSGDATTGVES
jgi:hypothetical protein